VAEGDSTVSYLTTAAVEARTRPADVQYDEHTDSYTVPSLRDGEVEYEVEDEYDLGVCMSCGGYGMAGRACRRTPMCREFGSEYM
jgi:hypothetical protein